MAIMKNKLKPKKGAKKKIDPFTRKEWYDVRAPNLFVNRNIGFAPVNKTKGKVLAEDGLKGRVYKVSLADLNADEDQAHRIITLVAEDVQGRQVLTSFHGMTFTTDKLKSLVRKWQTLIECNVLCRTTDGYRVRLFCIAFTKRVDGQAKKTSYAQTAQIKRIRAKMAEIMTREAQNSDIRQLFEKFIPEAIGTQIERECRGIYPLQNVFVRKCKILSRPAFDSYKLSELHGESKTAEELGTAVEGEPTPEDDDAFFEGN